MWKDPIPAVEDDARDVSTPRAAVSARGAARDPGARDLVRRDRSGVRDRRRPGALERRVVPGGPSRALRRRRPRGRLAAASRACGAGRARGARARRTRRSTTSSWSPSRGAPGSSAPCSSGCPRRRRSPGRGGSRSPLSTTCTAMSRRCSGPARAPADGAGDRPPARATLPLPARQRRSHAAPRRGRSLAGTGCSARRSTTLRARRSTRARACSGSATRAGRRSTGWPGRATRRPSGSRSPACRGLDFSFSGLKTALLYAVRDLEPDGARAAARRPRRLLPACDRPGPRRAHAGGGRADAGASASPSSAALPRTRSYERGSPTPGAVPPPRSSCAPTTRR